MKYKSRDFYIARCEALTAENMELQRVAAHLRDSLAIAQFDARNLQSEVTALRSAVHQAIKDEESITFGALQERCKRLNANGVPAMIHRGHIIHQRSRAVINPGQFGVGT